MATTLAPMTSTADELLQAEAKLWCNAFGYLNSMALQSAIKLGIPNAIHRLGGVASLSELHAAVPVATSKRPCLSRLLRRKFLAPPLLEVLGHVGYPHGGNPGRRRPLVVMIASPFFVAASQSLADWLQKEDAAVAATEQGETPFTVAHGDSLYGFLARDASSSFSACFKKAMESDSGFLVDIIVRDCTQVFAGVTSLVDVGGGSGTMARAIAKAFPHVRCSVLELPYVVDAAPADSAVEFLVGDMMEFIPPADVAFFKTVLHNWSDEECIRILKRAKEAISTGEAKGKVVIVDVVMGYPSNKQASDAQVSLDLKMMVVTTGKMRGEEIWHTIFLAAGFTRYKIVPGLGIRSLIEVYP